MVRDNTDTDDQPEPDKADRWLTYYETTHDRPPSPLLIAALTYVSAVGDALDLGCGAFRDTRELLKRGFRVTAVDSHPAVAEMATALPQDHLECVISTFTDFRYGNYELVNASFSLPFNSPENFDEMFANVMKSIKPGGIFIGQLFGVNDSWNTPDTGLTFHTQEQVEALLKDNGMHIIEMTTEEEDGLPAVGPLKHWHVFHIIARKGQGGSDD